MSTWLEQDKRVLKSIVRDALVRSAKARVPHSGRAQEQWNRIKHGINEVLDAFFILNVNILVDEETRNQWSLQRDKQYVDLLKMLVKLDGEIRHVLTYKLYELEKRLRFFSLIR